MLGQVGQHGGRVEEPHLGREQVKLRNIASLSTNPSPRQFWRPRPPSPRRCRRRGGRRRRWCCCPAPCPRGAGRQSVRSKTIKIVCLCIMCYVMVIPGPESSCRNWIWAEPREQREPKIFFSLYRYLHIYVNHASIKNNNTRHFEIIEGK